MLEASVKAHAAVRDSTWFAVLILVRERNVWRLAQVSLGIHNHKVRHEYREQHRHDRLLELWRTSECSCVRVRVAIDLSLVGSALLAFRVCHSSVCELGVSAFGLAEDLSVG